MILQSSWLFKTLKKNCHLSLVFDLFGCVVCRMVMQRAGQTSSSRITNGDSSSNLEFGAINPSGKIPNCRFESGPHSHTVKYVLPEVNKYMKNYICEYCGKEHDGSYGSGRFCSKHCRGAFTAKMSKKHKRNEMQICPYCNE